MRYLLLLGFGVLLVVGVFVLVGRVAGYTKTLNRIENANPVWLAVCFASQVVSYAAFVVLFRALARFDSGPRLDRWLTTRVVFAGLGATRLIAAAGAGGLAVLYWALRQAGFGRRTAFVRVLALNVLLYAAFGGGAIVAALALLVGIGGSAPLAMTLPWIVGVAGCVAAGVWVSGPGPAARLTPGDDAGRVRQVIGSAVAAVVLVRRLAEDRRANIATLVGAPVYWVGDVACLWAALRAFDIELAVPALVLAYATGFIANMIPLPTGGIGGVDAATTFALTVLGVPLAPALLAVFTYRFFSFLLPTLPAVVALPTLQRLGRELRGHAAATQQA